MNSTKVKKIILSAKFDHRINDALAEVKATVRYDPVTNSVEGIQAVLITIGDFVAYLNPGPESYLHDEPPDLPTFLLNNFSGLKNAILKVDWKCVHSEHLMPRISQLLKLNFVKSGKDFMYGDQEFYVSNIMVRELDEDTWNKWILLFRTTCFTKMDTSLN